MSNENVLELSTLPARHPPVGAALLDSCAACVIVRLSIDPTPQLSGTMDREVEIDWLKRPGNESPEQIRRRIGWRDQEERRAACEQLSIARNAHYIAEGAAIGVAALLIHELERSVIQNVLPIGSEEGDYLVRVSGENSFIHLEMSGLRIDPTGSGSVSVLRKKAESVLRNARVGFVSVTTFSHGPEAIVHSFLHFVKRSGRNAAQRNPKKKPGDGRKGNKK